MYTALLFDKIDIAVYSVVGAVAFIILAAYLIGYIVFRCTFRRSNATFKPDSKFTDMLMGPNFNGFFAFAEAKRESFRAVEKETLQVKTTDGLTLEGYFYKCDKETDKTVLFIHGYNSTGYIDFAPIAPEYLKRGYNVLFATNRACGNSEGKYTGFGTLERLDSLLWINWLTARYPDGDIFLQGMSLGAATVLMMTDLNLPKNVKAAVSDCAFSSLSYEMKDIFKTKAHLPKWPLMNILEFWCRRLAKYSFNTYTPLISVKNAKLPVLFIHGEADRFIPVENCKLLYDACITEKDIYTVADAGHAASYYKDFDAYLSKTLGWFEKYQTK